MAPHRTRFTPETHEKIDSSENPVHYPVHHVTVGMIVDHQLASLPPDVASDVERAILQILERAQQDDESLPRGRCISHSEVTK